MSDFDLEPPKAPSSKKEKKGLFGNLFSKKTSTPTISVPQEDHDIPKATEQDLDEIRQRLGIGPVASGGDTPKEVFDPHGEESPSEGESKTEDAPESTSQGGDFEVSTPEGESGEANETPEVPTQSPDIVPDDPKEELPLFEEEKKPEESVPQTPQESPSPEIPTESPAEAPQQTPEGEPQTPPVQTEAPIAESPAPSQPTPEGGAVIDHDLVDDINDDLAAEQSKEFHVSDFAEHDDSASRQAGEESSTLAQEEIVQSESNEDSAFNQEELPPEQVGSEEESTLAREAPDAQPFDQASSPPPSTQSSSFADDPDENPFETQTANETPTDTAADAPSESRSSFADDVPFESPSEPPADSPSEPVADAPSEPSSLDEELSFESPTSEPEPQQEQAIVDAPEGSEGTTADDTQTETKAVDAINPIEDSIAAIQAPAQEEPAADVSTPETPATPETPSLDEELSFESPEPESTPKEEPAPVQAEPESIVAQEPPQESPSFVEDQVEEDSVVDEPKPSPAPAKPKKSIVTDEEKERLRMEAIAAAQKKFDAYVKKEEAITATFLKKEKTLNKYIEGEKKNFVKYIGMLSTHSGIVDAQEDMSALEQEHVKAVDINKLGRHLESEIERYESKIKELYTKKYDLFSGWLQEEATLLKKNSEKYEEEVRKTKHLLKIEAKDAKDELKLVKGNIKDAQKEYKQEMRKIAAAEKKFHDIEAKHKDLTAKHGKITEQLIDREVNIKAREKELEDHEKEKEKELAEKIATAQKTIDAKTKQIESLDQKLESATSRFESLQENIKTAKESKDQQEQEAKTVKAHLTEKQKDMRQLESDYEKLKALVLKKERDLSSLHRKEDLFKQQQQKAQELLEKREQGVLDKINTNEKLLRSIEIKKAALHALEEKIEREGFKSYLEAKLDQISPEDGSMLSDEENALSNDPEMGSKIHQLMQQTRLLLNDGNYAEAKKVYAQVREEYLTIKLPQEEKSLLYTKIRELYDDINLKMLEEHSETRYRDVQ